jgi:hypothetical protein
MGEASLKLQANPILSGGLGWAVVKEAYVRLKEGPSDSSKDIDHLRRGAIERRFGKVRRRRDLVRHLIRRLEGLGSRFGAGCL